MSGKPWPKIGTRRPDIPPVNKRPRCLQCGAVLKLHTRFVEVAVDADPPPRLTTWSWKRYGTEPPVGRFVRVWTGHYGGYGDDCFCGVRCGWRWAVRHAPKPRS